MLRKLWRGTVGPHKGVRHVQGRGAEQLREPQRPRLRNGHGVRGQELQTSGQPLKTIFLVPWVPLPPSN